MNRFIILWAGFCLFLTLADAQEIMEVEGAIKIHTSDKDFPDKGTIRFNPDTNDFEGWNGAFWTSLTGLQFEYIGQVTDADGNVYPTVKIGDQEWMARNLRTTTYHDRNRTPIPFIGHGSRQNDVWRSQMDGAYTFYDTASSAYTSWSIEEFGHLYNWFAVVDSKNLCPVGWRAPSNSDWLELLDNYGGFAIAGGNLKQMGFTNWQLPNLGADNLSGFTGIPSGARFDGFSSIGMSGWWWSTSGTSQPGLENEALRFKLSHDSEEVSSVFSNKLNGYAVRCLKN